MDYLDNSSETQFSVYGVLYKNSYFVLLLLLIVVFFVYKFFLSGLNLDKSEGYFSLNTNFLDNINDFFRTLWLNTKMESDSVVVDNNAKEGLLDRIVEKIENINS